MKKIRVVVLRINENKSLIITTEEIEKGLKSLNDIVGGYIEMPMLCRQLSKENIDMIINEEGKLIQLEPTIAIMDNGEAIDVVAGNVIFAGHNDNGETIGLTDVQVALVYQLLMKEGLFSSQNGNITLKMLEF